MSRDGHAGLLPGTCRYTAHARGGYRGLAGAPAGALQSLCGSAPGDVPGHRDGSGGVLAAPRRAHPSPQGSLVARTAPAVTLASPGARGVICPRSYRPDLTWPTSGRHRNRTFHVKRLASPKGSGMAEASIPAFLRSIPVVPGRPPPDVGLWWAELELGWRPELRQRSGRWFDPAIRHRPRTKSRIRSRGHGSGRTRRTTPSGGPGVEEPSGRPEVSHR